MADAEIYVPSTAGPLRQGEFLTDIIQIRLNVDPLAQYPDPDEEHVLVLCNHPIAVVVSQDCDLDWDYRDRERGSGPKLIPNVLLCEVASSRELRGRSDINSTIWQRVRANKDERYQFLERVPSDKDAVGDGLPEMALDFKRCFSIPTGEIYLQLQSQAKRRCRLVSPYLEHLSHRLFHFHARVGLPAEHLSEPSR